MMTAAQVKALVESLEAYNNTIVWVTDGVIFVDTLKRPVAIRACAAEHGAAAFTDVLYRPSTEEETAAWTGDGPTHGKSFGGRECLGYVLRIETK